MSPPADFVSSVSLCRGCRGRRIRDRRRAQTARRGGRGGGDDTSGSAAGAGTEPPAGPVGDNLDELVAEAVAEIVQVLLDQNGVDEVDLLIEIPAMSDPLGGTDYLRAVLAWRATDLAWARSRRRNKGPRPVPPVSAASGGERYGPSKKKPRQAGQVCA
jgi:hypothetical protein